MQKLKGTLVFSGNWLNRPWLLTQEDGTEVDLYPLIDELLRKMNGKPAKHNTSRDSYALTLDNSAEFVVKYEVDEIAVLEKSDGFGMSNIGAYLPDALTWLSGRNVGIEIGDDSFKIAADESEEVFGVKFFGGGNSCRIPEGADRSVCEVSTLDCCIFVTMGSDGFTCEKFGSMGRHLLDRHFHGTMRASRVGSCALVGRV